jgi:hypothetical protein
MFNVWQEESIYFPNEGEDSESYYVAAALASVRADII